MKKFTILLAMMLMSSFMFAQFAGEESPNADPNVIGAKGTMQFNYTGIPGGGSAGCETDGNNFYVTKWSGDIIWKFDMTGTLLDSFSVAGVSGLRDLAYDGTYFYGGASSNSIYQMDFDTATPYLVATINSPDVTVRNICYQPDSDAFWVSNWATDLTLVNRNGTVLRTILAATHNFSSAYGTAYDNVSPGGPYIWWISASSAVNTTITQINATTGIPTGIANDCTNDVCAVGELGGGLWIHDGIVTGTTTIGGLIQNTSIFGYDLASLGSSVAEIDKSNNKINNIYPNPAQTSTTISYTLNNTQNVEIAIHDILGKNVLNINKGNQASGEYQQEINCQSFNNGIYIVKVTIGDFVSTRKLITE